MIKRITVENYMAHRLTTLELAPGVTVITGPNNAGKSAIVEAFRAIAQNPPYRHAIRHGAKSAIVRVELDSGEVIEWDRSQRTAVYRLYRAEDGSGGGGTGAGTPETGTPEPETYAKLTARKPPDDVRTLLRLDLVETETGSIDIHIGNQRYPIFLLDQAGSQAASFFAASTEAEYLLRMQQALKRRADDARSRRKELLRECAEAERKIEHYIHLDDVEVVLAAAGAIFEKIHENRESIPAMEVSLLSLAEATGRLRNVAWSGSVLERLDRPPELHHLPPLEEVILDTDRTARHFDLRRDESGALSLLRPPPALHEVSRLEELMLSLAKSRGEHRKATARGSVLEDAASPPKLEETAALDRTCEQLRATVAALERSLSAAHAVSGLYSPPTLSDTAGMDGLLSGLEGTGGLLRSRLLQAEALTGLVAPPLPADVHALEQAVLAIETGLQSHRTITAECAVMQELRPPVELEDIAPLHDVISKVESLESEASGSRESLTILGELTTPPQLMDPGDLEGVFRSVSVLQEEIARVDHRMAILRSVRTGSEPLPVEDLKGTIDQMTALEAGIAESENRSESIEHILGGKRREVEIAIEESGICPLCGHPMDVVHFLEAMHG